MQFRGLVWAGVPWNSSMLGMVGRTLQSRRSEVTSHHSFCWLGAGALAARKGVKAEADLADLLFMLFVRSWYHHDGQCIDAVHDLPASWSKCTGVSRAGFKACLWEDLRQLLALRMCTMPMYEVLEDRSVRRFSLCLAISFLASWCFDGCKPSMMQIMTGGGKALARQACLSSSFASCQALALSFSSLQRSALWD